MVVVGASAGGVEALTKLVRALPRGYTGTLFVVLHIAPEGTSVMATILERAGSLPADQAEDGEAPNPVTSTWHRPISICWSTTTGGSP